MTKEKLGAAFAPPALQSPAHVAASSVAGLHCQTWGRGEVRWVGLHGWGGDHRTFAQLAPLMVQSRATAPGALVGAFAALDLPGYGESAPPATWSIEAIAGQVAAAILELSPHHPVQLVGTCSGAIFALAAALRAPHAVGSLVLSEPFAFVPWYLRLFTWPWVGPLFFWSTFQNPIGRWITDRSLANQDAGEQGLTASFRSASPSVSIEYLRLLHRIRGPRTFSNVRTTIHLMWGSRTFRAVRTSVAEWRDQWPSCGAEEVAGAGHLLVEEQPQAVANALLQLKLLG